MVGQLTERINSAKKGNIEKKGMPLMKKFSRDYPKQYHKNHERFENDFTDGVYAVPRSPQEPRVKTRALYNYCLEKKIQPSDLSEMEMEQFLER